MSNTASIPMFPLGIFKLPDEVIRLHIFEPRYRQLIKDIRSGVVQYFGIPAAFDNSLLDVGVLVSLDKILRKSPDGTYDITVKVIDLFKVVNFHDKLENKPYPGGEIKRLYYSGMRIHSRRISTKILELSDKYAPWFRMHTSQLTDLAILQELKLSDQEKLAYIQVESQAAKERFLWYQLRKLELFLMQHKSFSGNFNLN